MENRRILHVAGVLVLITMALSRLSPSAFVWRGSLAHWAIAYATLAVAYFATTRSPPRVQGAPPLVIAGLATQTVAALVLCYLGAAQFEAVALIAVASQLTLRVDPRVAIAWIVVQSIALTALLASAPVPASQSAVYAASLFAFQAFAAGAALLVQREARARVELARANAELRATQTLLGESVRAAERLRISRELHDAIGHHLTAMALHLDVAARTSQGPAAEHAAIAREIARNQLADVRAAVGELRDGGAVDLRVALSELVRGFDSPRVHLRVADDLHVREAGRAHALFRCVQEIVTNAVRHAHASNVWVELAQTGARITLHAHDDGAGVAEVRPGMGLRGLTERFSELDGEVLFASHPGRGFEVNAMLPLAERAA